MLPSLNIRRHVINEKHFALLLLDIIVQEGFYNMLLSLKIRRLLINKYHFAEIFYRWCLFQFEVLLPTYHLVQYNTKQASGSLFNCH